MLWLGRDVVRASSDSAAAAALARSWGALTVIVRTDTSDAPTLSWDRPVLGQLAQYLGKGPLE